MSKANGCIVVYLRGNPGRDVNAFFRIGEQWGCSIRDVDGGLLYLSYDKLPILTRERMKEQILQSLKRKKLVCERGINILEKNVT